MVPRTYRRTTPVLLLQGPHLGATVHTDAVSTSSENCHCLFPRLVGGLPDDEGVLSGVGRLLSGGARVRVGVPTDDGKKELAGSEVQVLGRILSLFLSMHSETEANPLPPPSSPSRKRFTRRFTPVHTDTFNKHRTLRVVRNRSLSVSLL